MCRYRYTYYDLCQHAELYRTSYCDKAKALGLPERDDESRTALQLTDATGAGGQTDSTLGLDHSRSSAAPSALEQLETLSNLEQPRHQHATMSVQTPPQAPRVRSWAEVASSSDERPRPADYIPRSVQSNTSAPKTFSPARSREPHPNVSQSSSTLENTGYSKLNIDIPMDPYASFSVQVTHENDGSRPHASSISTASGQESDTDEDTIRGLSLSQTPATVHGRPSIQSTPHVTDSDTDWLPQPISAVHPNIRPDFFASDHPLLPAKSVKGKGKLAETPAEEIEEVSPRSPRKALPTQWTGKSSGPMLATAQRAMQRESRKKTSHTGSPSEAGRMSYKSQGADTTYLTKVTADAVESSTTSQTLPRTPTKVRHGASRSELNTPTRSPVRDTLGHNSKVQITVSPTKSPKAAQRGVDGRSSDSTCEIKKRGGGHSSNSSGDTPYVTAKHSPVSHSSRSSEHSFVTAPEELHTDVPDLDLADIDGIEQTTRGLRGIRSQPVLHSQSKADTHLKARMVKPAVPKLALTIPPSSSSSTDHETPFTLGSASDSASAASMTPSSTSRIPRLSSTVQPGEEAPATSVKLSKSMKSLHLMEERGTSPAVQGSRRARQPTSTRELDPSKSTPSTIEPHRVPLPETPVNAPVRHVRTVNSTGATPILSRKTPETTSESGSLVKTWASQLRETNPNASASSSREVSTQTATDMGMISEKPSLDDRSLSSSQISLPTRVVNEGNASAQSGISTATSIQSQSSRITSIASSVASEATVRGSTREDDPVAMDTAIIYSRRRSHASAVPIAPFKTSTAEMPAAMLPAAGESGVVHGHNTSPTRSRESDFPGRREQSQSEFSTLSNRPFSFRPTAAVFVPRHQAEMISEASNVPADVSPFYPPPMDFSPYAVGASGIPMYYHMYTVPIGSGGDYNFNPNWKQASPRKKRNKKTFAARGRKSRSDETHSSPTKSEQVENHPAANELGQAGGEQAASSSRPGSLAESQRTSMEQLRQSVGSPAGSASYEPFASQLDTIARQAAERKEEPRTVGRGSRRIDWAGVRNAHYETQQQMISQQAAAAQGYGPYDHWAQQSSHAGPSGHSRHRHWHASAGVPLESTAPFPDPVAPTGLSRSESNVSSSNEYVGHTEPQPTDCGEFKIESAAEWGGRACNECDKSNH